MSCTSSCELLNFGLFPFFMPSLQQASLLLKPVQRTSPHPAHVLQWAVTHDTFQCPASSLAGKAVTVLVLFSFPGTCSVVLIMRSVITIMLLAMLMNREFTFPYSFIYCDLSKVAAPAKLLKSEWDRQQINRMKDTLYPVNLSLKNSVQLIMSSIPVLPSWWRLSHCTQQGLEG